MKSFIPWIGGKSQLCSTILSYFPAKNPDRYVEVFGGGGSVLFAKDKHANIEIFNDFNGNLINLYRCIKYHSGELQRELCMIDNLSPPTSRELFFDYLAQINLRGLTDIQRAARYYYIIRTSFSADCRTFGCNKKNFANYLNQLPKIQQRLQSVVIENQDFEALIKVQNKVNTLFYIDPPYYNAEKYYDGFANNDHLRLLKSIQTIKSLFILSYNDTPEVRQLYADYNIYSFDRANCLTHIGRYKELIITNF